MNLGCNRRAKTTEKHIHSHEMCSGWNSN